MDVGDNVASLVSRRFGGARLWYAIKSVHWHGNTNSQLADYEPVTELAELEQAFDESQGALKQDLREKLELLLPKPVDPDYLSFLAGQLELVFETYRVNVLKRSSDRCYPVGSGPTQTQSNEQAIPPRRLTRRSRRSTMLQTLQRNTHAVSLPTETPSNGKGGRQNSHNLNQQFLLRKSEAYLGWKTMEDRERSRPVTVATHIELPTNEPDISGSFAANPRDSRDSGISMPCDTCSTEPCRCDEMTASNKDGHLTSSEQHHRHDKPMLQEQLHDRGQIPRSEFTDGRSATTQHQHKHPHVHHRVPARRSRLDIQSDELHLSYTGSGDGSSDHADGTIVNAGGRFSPQSFKQRLLRQQLTGA